jgi:hypothetical protein
MWLELLHHIGIGVCSVKVHANASHDLIRAFGAMSQHSNSTKKKMMLTPSGKRVRPTDSASRLSRRLGFLWQTMCRINTFKIEKCIAAADIINSEQNGDITETESFSERKSIGKIDSDRILQMFSEKKARNDHINRLAERKAVYRKWNVLIDNQQHREFLMKNDREKDEE